MPLRRRLALTVALVATAIVIFGGAAAWLTARSVLRGTIDDALRAQAQEFRDGPRRFPGERLQQLSDSGSTDQAPIDPTTGRPLQLPDPPARLGGPAEYAQALLPDGRIILRGDVALPVDGLDRAAVGDEDGNALARIGPRTVTVGDARLRMITVALTPGLAIQFARPLNGVDRALRTLLLVLLALGAASIAAAAALGRTAARRILRPVADLAAAAAHVEATADLNRRLPDATTGDELGELTRRFNGMLTRLQGSRRELDRSITEQRNLVADASHELRTPVTSLRTNAEVLLEDDENMSVEERRQTLGDIRDQAEDLGLLVADLIELARGDAPEPARDEPVALDSLVATCVDRAQRDHRSVPFVLTTTEAAVTGRPDRIARAVSNLLNNAATHGAADDGTPITVTVAVDDDHAIVRVVDHGPGVPTAERGRIFDRFRRGDHARTHHGSGLGLAIVRQVAVTHRGDVQVEETPGGGATFVLRLPTA